MLNYATILRTGIVDYILYYFWTSIAPNKLNIKKISILKAKKTNQKLIENLFKKYFENIKIIYQEKSIHSLKRIFCEGLNIN